MKIRIIAVGNRMPNWVQTAWNDYSKRFPRHIAISLHEIKPQIRNSRQNTQQFLELEAQRIRSHFNPGEFLVALDERGKDINTEQMAQQLAQWHESGFTINFLIGGPDGLDEGLKKQCNTQWRLSSLTMAHPFVRVLLIEQIYRCWSILSGHPYHRS